MLRVGLTGSIAVGKSFVASVFRDLGCHVIDADALARDVVEPGGEGIQAIVDAFGFEFLNADGSLNRPKLGRLVFQDSDKLARLNAVMHPRIAALQDELLARLETVDPDGVAIVEGAVLIESGGYKRFSKVVVVYCRPEIQLARLVARNDISTEDAELRISSQMSQDEKKEYADFVIDTSDGFHETRRQTNEVFLKLKANRISNRG